MQDVNGRSTILNLELPAEAAERLRQLIREDDPILRELGVRSVAPNSILSILIVDNDPLINRENRLMLQGVGYRVFTAESVEQAKTILQKERIHLAIIGVRLRDDNDPNDVSGLDLAAELEPPVFKIILTGFQSAEITRRALLPHFLKQVAPAENIIAKQDGPRRLKEAADQVFSEKILRQINLQLDLKWKSGISMGQLVAPLGKSLGIDNSQATEEVEELLRRLFWKESVILLYRLVPASSSTVILVRPEYQQVKGSLVVVKMGPIDKIDAEVRNYREYVEPYAHRHTTILAGQPVRTHRLAGFKLLFLNSSDSGLSDFNDLYHDPGVPIARLQKIVANLFGQTCRIWYQNKQPWPARAEDDSVMQLLQGQLSLSSADGDEPMRSLEYLLEDQPLSSVSFERESSTQIRARVEGREHLFPDPLVFAKEDVSLVTPTYASIVHGDLNVRNLLIDEDTDIPRLIDFSRAGWGPALSDAAGLETVVKFELIHQERRVNLPDVLAFEEAVLEPSTFLGTVRLPSVTQSEPFRRALSVIEVVRAVARDIAESRFIHEYYLLLLFYALKMMTWKGISSLDQERQELRRRHALFSAGLLSKKLTKIPEIGDRLYIDQSSKTVWVDDRPVELAPLEFLLIEYLYNHRGEVCSRNDILSHLYMQELAADGVSDYRLDSVLKRLRQRVEPKPSSPQFIITVRGLGLQLLPAGKGQDE